MKDFYLIAGFFLFFFNSDAFGTNEQFLSPPKNGRKGSFLYIGKPYKKAPNKGSFFKTMEMEINVGSFDGTSHIGYKLGISSEERDIYNEFDSLDDEKLYIFELEIKTYWLPEKESTHFMLKKIYYFEDLNDDLEKSIESTIGRSGTFNPSASRTGKIINVRRWEDAFSLECAILVSFGGLSSGESGGVNRKLFNIYNEHACVWAEKVLKTGRTVEIEYSEQRFEIVEYSSRIAHKLTIKDDSSSAITINENISLKHYKNIMSKLLDDKDFISKLREKLDDQNDSKRVESPSLTNAQLIEQLQKGLIEHEEFSQKYRVTGPN